MYSDNQGMTNAPDQKKQHGGARPGSGRRPIAEDSPTVGVLVRMSAEQRAKLKALGGSSWVRRRIDEAGEAYSPPEGAGGRRARRAAS